MAQSALLSTNAALSASDREEALAEVRQLITDLRATSEEFERYWGSAIFGEHRESRKTVQNALVGPITFDCDVLAAPGSDLKIVVYTVVPGSEDAAKLDLLRVSAVRAFA